MEMSEQIDQLASALSMAQSEMAHASKDKQNPAFKSRYADLASIMDACREPLTKNGIAVIQAPKTGDGVLTLETRFVHKSGQWISTTITATLPDQKVQTIGSAVTYLRRYGLAAMAGVAPDDDDGNAATPPHRHHAAAQRHDQSMTVADAVKRLAERYPHLERQAIAIADLTISDDEKIDRMRDLYKTAPKETTA